MSHRRAKLTVNGRKLLIERILEHGWAVPVAADAQGVSVATAYKWLRRYHAEGDAGLVDRSSRPQRSPRRTCPDREAAIIQLRRSARVGPHRIAWALGESQSTVYAVLKRHRMPRLAHLDRVTGAPVRYERERPGELVHIDVKRQGRIPDGGAGGDEDETPRTSTAAIDSDHGPATVTTISISPSMTGPGSLMSRSMTTSYSRPPRSSPSVPSLTSTNSVLLSKAS